MKAKCRIYVTLGNQVEIQDNEELEAYPKAGGVNPIADIYIYNLQSKKTVRVDTRDGKPFDNDAVIGYYVYNVRWTPDGSELLYNRTDRRQKIMEITAADPATGMSRVVVHEANPDGYTENLPEVTFFQGWEGAFCFVVVALRLEELLSVRSLREINKSGNCQQQRF